MDTFPNIKHVLKFSRRAAVLALCLNSAGRFRRKWLALAEREVSNNWVQEQLHAMAGAGLARCDGLSAGKKLNFHFLVCFLKKKD